MCSESSNTSPRISFSHDLCQTDAVPVEDYPYRSDSSLWDTDSEFDFCISSSNQNEPSSADELFSDGLIRPLQLQERFVTTKHHSISKPQRLNPLPPLSVSSTNGGSKQENFKEVKGTSTECGQKQKIKSFWGIKRSSSIHCDNSHKKSSFWPLPVLSRSKSTGSVPSSKQTSKENHKHKQLKNSIPLCSSSASISYTYPLSQKPPLKKSYGGSYGNGTIQVSPILNVPSPYISKRSAALFGLGSLFRNGKGKKNKI